MNFDFADLHIEGSSPEGQNLQSIIDREHVSPEEALRRALRHAVKDQPNPAQRLIGLFSSPEDALLMDEVMELGRESRHAHTTRDIGL